MIHRNENIVTRYKEFVLYFAELDKIGAPYNTNDLIAKAEELGLPIPSEEIKKEIEIEVDKFAKASREEKIEILSQNIKKNQEIRKELDEAIMRLNSSINEI